MPDRIGQQWGNYRLLHLLGRGGFAEVYLGQHVRLTSQRAALKILSTQLYDGEIEKFHSEAETIVSLVHPHIVRVLDFALNEGTPYLVMDYAVGGSLRQKHLRGAQVELATVVSYVQQIAQGLQYAHDRKIIHRDIKPDNMLIGIHGEILLSDFGIATIAHATSSQIATVAAGTVPYMAPEQIQEHPRPASDQYALAITVYEWLTGTAPFTGTFTEVAIKHVMVSPPSLRNWTPNLPSEVEQVILTALSKDPRARFQSVQAFATALTEASHYDGSKGSQLIPDVRSTPSASLTPSVPPMPLTNLTPPIWPTPSVTPTPPAPPVSSANLTPPIWPTPSAQSVQQAQSDPTIFAGPDDRTIIASHTKQDSQSQGTPISRAFGNVNTGGEVRRQDERTAFPTPIAYNVTEPPPPIVNPSPLRKEDTKHQKVSRRAVSVGLLIALGLIAVESSVLVWNSSHSQHLHPSSTPKPPPLPSISKGTLFLTYYGHTEAVRSIAWSPNGELIASGGEDKSIQIWDANNGTKSISYAGHPAQILSIAWSPDGKLIASGARDKTAQVWDATTGATIFKYKGHTDDIHGVAWSPDGKYVASGSDDTTVHICDASTGAPTFKFRGHTLPVESVQWSPDGKHIVSASDDATVQIWNPSTEAPVFKYQGHNNWVLSARWSPDGKRIASTGRDMTVQVWDASTGTVFFTYHGHTNWVEKLAWSPDGKYIATASDDHTVHIVDAHTGKLRFKYQESHEVYAVIWSLDGKRIASGGNDKIIQVWSAS